MGGLGDGSEQASPWHWLWLPRQRVSKEAHFDSYVPHLVLVGSSFGNIRELPGELWGNVDAIRSLNDAVCRGQIVWSHD